MSKSLSVLSLSYNRFSADSLLKVTRVVICIHSAINKYKLSQQQEKEL